MNIDSEIGIRVDTCQRSALSLGCRRAWGRYRRATVACRHFSTLKAATFPLYLPGEACLPFTGLIFLLEPLTIYSLPPLLPPQATVLSLMSTSFPFPFLCSAPSVERFPFSTFLSFDTAESPTVTCRTNI